MLKRRKKSLSEYSTGELVMFRFRKNKLAMFGVFLLAFVFLAVLAAPILSSYENVTKLHISDRFTSPNPLYIFGTDEFGRDLFARVLYGGRISLLCSFAIIGIAFVVGALIGGAAGFFGGKVDSFLMRIVDILMAVPSSLLAMAIITAMGNGVWKLVVALAISQVARFARIVRSSVLTLRNVEFVEAAKCYGCSSLRIILKHILPNVVSVILVTLTLDFAGCMLTESSLSYLCFGVHYPRPTWGNMLNGANNATIIGNYWWQWLFTSLFLAITTICINIVGDTLRDVMDPKSNIDK